MSLGGRGKKSRKRIVGDEIEEALEGRLKRAEQ